MPVFFYGALYHIKQRSRTMIVLLLRCMLKLLDYISWVSRLRIETFSSMMPRSDEIGTRSCSMVSR